MRGLLIRGGTVVDGTGRPGVRADVRVRAGRIAEVGHGLAAAGEMRLDADGALVTPGFIDTHTHFDPSLFWDPFCDPMPQHGVTTVVMGNCSLSLAPVRPEHRGDLGGLFCYVEDLPARVFEDAVRWEWSSFPEYHHLLRSRGYGVNVVPLVGHTALRLYVLGDAAWHRPAAGAERAQLARSLEQAISGGAMGLSTSLFDEDASKRPVPSRLADDAEFAELLDVLAAHGRPIAFIPDVSHSESMLSGVERIAGLCRASGVVGVWNGLLHDERKPQRATGVLDQAARLQASGARVYPQVSPRRLDIRVNWRGGMAFYSLGQWHLVVQAPDDEMRRLLMDPSWRALAREEWDAKPRTLLRHHELGKMRLISVSRPEHDRWVGRTLADLVTDRGGHPSDVLADWVLANDLDPGIVGLGVANADPAGVAALLRHPATIISASDAGAHLQMMCAAGDTTLLLTRHVRDRCDITLEQAVWELTARQADLFGLAGRGRIAIGAAADMVIFCLDELAWLDETLADDLPGGSRRLRRPAGGYRYTIVGGVITQEGGTLAGALPGKALTD